MLCYGKISTYCLELLSLSVANVSHLFTFARWTSPGCGTIRSSLLKLASVALEAINFAVLDACIMLSFRHLALWPSRPGPGLVLDNAYVVVEC